MEFFYRQSLVLPFILLIFLISGCPAPVLKEGMLQNALNESSAKDLSKTVPKVIADLKLKKEGKNRLLYQMELGTFKHLARKYKESNIHFRQADQIADALYTKSVQSHFASMMTNPRSGDYGGTDLENVYLNYYGALNYLQLGMGETDKKVRNKFLEKAQIEVRKIEIKLNKLANENGSYKEFKDKEATIFSTLIEIFNIFSGNINKKQLVYREDAYLRYINGLIYELQGIYDDARISYQKSAELYESGYAKQYALDKENLAQQAWFDVARMLKLEGDRLPYFLSKKLRQDQQQRLRKLKRGKSETEIIVIQHVGEIPMRKKLNFHCTIDVKQKSLILTPIIIDTSAEGMKEKIAWFSMLYANNSPLTLIHSYAKAGGIGVLQSLTSKTIHLGPLWNVAEKIGLIQSIALLGIRVVVPYYSPPRPPIKTSTVVVNGKSYPTLKMETLSTIALQEQFKNAGNDLRNALAREAMKSITGDNLSELAGSYAPLFSMASKLTGVLTAGAETRNWRTLPYSIRIARIPVQAGQTQILLKTQFPDGTETISNHQILLKNGEIKIWNPRTISKHLKR